MELSHTVSGSTSGHNGNPSPGCYCKRVGNRASWKPKERNTMLQGGTTYEPRKQEIQVDDHLASSDSIWRRPSRVEHASFDELLKLNWFQIATREHPSTAVESAGVQTDIHPDSARNRSEIAFETELIDKYLSPIDFQKHLTAADPRRATCLVLATTISRPDRPE